MSDIPKLNARAAHVVRIARNARTGPSENERERLRHGVLLTAGASTAFAHGTAQAAWWGATKSAAESAVLWSLSHAKVIVLATLVSGSAVVGVVMSNPTKTTHALAPAESPAQSTIEVVPYEHEPETAPAPVAALEAPATLEGPETVATPRRSSTRVRTANVPISMDETVVAEVQPASVRISRLADEARLIASADQALRSNHIEAARELLAQHTQEFARGALVRERQALLLIAACSDAPHEARVRILEQASPQVAPNSQLYSRLAAMCR